MAEIDVTRIAGNIGAMNALNSLSGINKQLSVHQTRLATGKRINTAADDPAGLTIATKMLSRSEGLKVALGNIGDAKNLLAVAESGLGRINDILVQMRNKAEAAASDTLGPQERKAIITQLKAYAAQIDDIAAQTEWNGNQLINGDYENSGLTFQTGAGSSDYTVVSGLKDMAATGSVLALATKASANTLSNGDNGDGMLNAAPASVANATFASGSYTLSINAGLDEVTLTSSEGAVIGTAAVDISSADDTATIGGVDFVIDSTAIATDTYTFDYVKNGDYTILSNGTAGDALTDAADFRGYMTYIGNKLDVVSEQLSLIGATTGRLSFKEDQVAAAQINVEAAYNRIMNANMAEEQVNASKFQILQQTATAMLAQANAAPQFLLSLFR